MGSLIDRACQLSVCPSRIQNLTMWKTVIHTSRIQNLTMWKTVIHKMIRGDNMFTV